MLDNLPLFIYFSGLVNPLSHLLLWMGVLTALTSGLASVITLICHLDDKNDVMFFRWSKKLLKVVFIAFVPIFLGVLIPSERTVYAMIAASGASELVKNERVQELGGKSLDVLEKFMSEYLEEQDAN